MTDTVLMLFMGSVFATVFILSQALILPNLGNSAKQRKRLKHRFDNILNDRSNTHQQLLKQQYLDQLSPVARLIESMPSMAKLKLYLEQAGYSIPAYRFVLISFLVSSVIAYFVWNHRHAPLVTLGTMIICFILPFFWLQKKRKANLNKFDELFPETLDMMARSLRTGFPFIDCIKIVSEEMPEPIRTEFGILFDEINYGRNLQMALALMVERVPSLSLNAMATSVLIQKDTGGDMAEILLKIGKVLRGRFKLQRRVKTLSAEGIFSAWILCLTPFIMFFVLSSMNKDHFNALYQHPDGMQLFYAIGVMQIVAVIWIRKIINIDI